MKKSSSDCPGECSIPSVYKPVVKKFPEDKQAKIAAEMAALPKGSEILACHHCGRVWIEYHFDSDQLLQHPQRKVIRSRNLAKSGPAQEEWLI